MMLQLRQMNRFTIQSASIIYRLYNDNLDFSHHANAALSLCMQYGLVFDTFSV